VSSCVSRQKPPDRIGEFDIPFNSGKTANISPVETGGFWHTETALQNSSVLAISPLKRFGATVFTNKLIVHANLALPLDFIAEP
jgi:hypothetical protein